MFIALCPALCQACTLQYLIQSSQPYKVSTIFNPHFTGETQSLREVKSLSQSHTARKQLFWESYPSICSQGLVA